MKATNSMRLSQHNAKNGEPPHSSWNEAEGVLSWQLARGLDYLKEHITLLPAPYPGCILFFTIASESKASCVFFVRASTLDAAWRKGAIRVRQWAWARQEDAVELRIDWVQDITPLQHEGVQPVHASWSHPSSKTMALADAGLEKAALLLQFVLADPDMKQSSDDHGLHPAACPIEHLEQFATQASLVLHLRGIYFNGKQAEVAVPHMESASLPTTQQYSRFQTPSATVLDMLLQQQSEGSWQASDDFRDHLGFTYALLQTQRHMDQRELERTLNRAIAYTVREQKSLPRDTATTAMALLVLSRFLNTTHYTSEENLRNLLPLMEELAQGLDAAAQTTPQTHSDNAADWVWSKLALHAYSLAGRSQSIASKQAIEPNNKQQFAIFIDFCLQCLNKASGADRGIQSSAQWQAIALAEIAQLQADIELQPSQDLRRWSAALQRGLDSMSERTVWPELAMYLPPILRRQAVFLQPDSLDLLFEPCPTLQLFTIAAACVELLGKFTRCLQPGLKPVRPTKNSHNKQKQAFKMLAIQSANAAAATALTPLIPLSSSPMPSSGLTPATGATHAPMAWPSAAVAELMQGQWMSAPYPVPPELCFGLQITRQHQHSGAAVLVRHTGLPMGVPPAALPAVQAASLISNAPENLLRHDRPVLHAPDINYGLKSWAQAARQRIKTPVIAATGCAGKTSTLSMLRQCLLGHGDVRGDAVFAQNAALQMINWSDTSPCVFAEIPLQTLDEDLQLIAPDILIITNLPRAPQGEEQVHTQRQRLHSDEQSIAQEILDALQLLRPGATLVLSQEICSSPALVQVAKDKDVRALTFGQHHKAQVQGIPLRHRGLRAMLNQESVDLPLQAEGGHMAMNALATLATLVALNVPLSKVKKQLALWQPLPGTGQPQQLPNGVCLLDHSLSKSLTSMRAAFAQLHAHTPYSNQRIIVLAGLQPEDGYGEHAKQQLQELIRSVPARRVLLCGDQLRKLADSLSDLLYVNWYDDLNELTNSLLRTKHKGDCVLLAGRETVNLAIVGDAIRENATEFRPNWANENLHPMQ